MSKYGIFSGPYFPVFGLNAGKYGPKITPYLDTFHAVELIYTFFIQSFFHLHDYLHNFTFAMPNPEIE